VTTTTVLLIAFAAFGACFGLATFSRRHLFSEGPSRASKRGDEDDTPMQRVIWTLTCSALWPLMVLTGVVSLWRLRRARLQQRREADH
jgi:thiosulfate reductase cytochrome b subunit